MASEFHIYCHSSKIGLHVAAEQRLAHSGPPHHTQVEEDNSQRHWNVTHSNPIHANLTNPLTWPVERKFIKSYKIQSLFIRLVSM